MSYPNGKKTYAELDLQERWLWHSGIYAWRHVALDAELIPGTSPTDPLGEWFDAVMIADQLDKIRRKRAPRRNPAAKPDDDGLKGRELCNAYARSRGFTDFDQAFNAGKISYAETAAWVLAASGGLRKMPGVDQASEYNIKNLQKDLGISAAENFAPTAAEMASSRAGLGIPEPPPLKELTNA